MSKVHVKVASFLKLVSDSVSPLAIDTYQRGFVWDDGKVKQLIDDLKEYDKLSGEQPPYYMGTILLHRHEEKAKLFIIDGQQRVTALSLLYHSLTGKMPPNCEMTYSPASAKCIVKAAEVFKQYTEGVDPSIFERIHMTVITVDSVDLAFTFFDTQNNRGVPLHGTDLLKAYHLRAIDGDSRDQLQTLCASKWEQIQRGRSVIHSQEGFVASLFSKFLWRARTWKGTQVRFETHDGLMEEFQQRSRIINGGNENLPLYRARNNRLGGSLTLREAGHSEIQPCPITLGSESADLPFAIRQPVHKGVGFFLYADKYAGLLHRLMHEETNDADIVAYRDYYEKVVGANSLFLKEVYLLASLMYLDQFGSERLFEFSMWLDHGLGAIRIGKQSVYQQAAKNYFNYHEGRTFNLLDAIANAFVPDEVIRELKNDAKSHDVYQSEQVNSGERVRGRYKAAVLNYFQKDASESLAARGSWIESQLKIKQEGKL